MRWYEHCVAICDWCGALMNYRRGQGGGWWHHRLVQNDAICFRIGGLDRSITVLPGVKNLGTFRQSGAWAILGEAS